jgi:DNA-binding winged helix-turn-helix (wHTH) protein
MEPAEPLPSAEPSGRPISFGPFELDAVQGELRKRGVRVKLQEQPFQILQILLEHPGKLVTRDDLRNRIWPADTFVDFDKGLYNAIKKLRESLGDEAGTPRYIETVPKRGYRFIAPLNGGSPIAGAANGGSPANASAGVAGDAPPPGPVLVTEQLVREARPISRRPLYSWKILGPVILIGVLIAGASWYLRFRRAAKLTEQDTIVLADFTNTTGDAIFDDTLKTALSISLRQSPFLNVLSDSRVAKTLRLMTRPADTKITPAVARELCLRAGGKAYIAGSISSLGSEYVLDLRAVNCESDDPLTENQMTTSSKEKVLDVLGKSASRLRGELGESLSTVQKYDVPLAAATTPSLEALQAFSLGKKAFNEKGPAAALPYHQRSIQLDPNFAMGYEAAGTDYFDLLDLGRAHEYLTKAFELRERTSEPEKLGIAASYYQNVTGELDKATESYQQSIENYPRVSAPYYNLGLVFEYQGQYAKAAEITQQGMRQTRDQAGQYLNLANYAISLQRFDEAHEMIHEAQARKEDDPMLRIALYALAFLRADPSAMAEQQRWFAGKPAEFYGIALASDTEAYAGHLARSRELTKHAVDSAIRADSKETGATWQAIAAQREAAYGDPQEARRTAAEALKLAPTSQGVETEAALAFALAGDTARAESLAQDLEKRFPLDTQVQSLWLPAIQAQLSLNNTTNNTQNNKKADSALNALQASTRIELGAIPFTANPSCLYHVYIRAEAYLAANQGPAAAAEFQKIIDHSGIVWNCWTGALAHLGLARANAIQANALLAASPQPGAASQSNALQSKPAQGQSPEADAAQVRALAAYKDFLTLWRDADPNLPILKEAKTEYTTLQKSQAGAASNPNSYPLLYPEYDRR